MVVAGTNSFVSMAEAEAYFSTRLDAAAWTEATATLKEQALVTATQSLEQNQWIGVIADPDQALSWPRVGSFFDPRLGYVTTLKGIPDRIKKAQMELAYHYLNNDGVLDNSASVTKVKVGPIEIDGLARADASSSVAYAFISPLLSRRASGAWWRAN